MDDAHDTDKVMPMYNLIEHSNNYLKQSGILRQFCKDVLAKNVVTITLLISMQLMILVNRLMLR